MTGEFAPESFGGVLLSGNAFNFLGVPPVVGRTIQPSDIRRRRAGRAGRGAEPQAVAPAVRRQSVGRRPDAAPQRSAAHHHRRDAAAIRLVRQRRVLAAARAGRARTCRSINPIVRLAPGVSKAAAEEQLQAFNTRLAHEKPATFPPQGFTTTLRNYLDVTVASGEMRTSLRLLLGARGVPAADRLRQRRQPAARARHRAGARDGGPDVDRRRPPAAAAPAADRERAALARRRRARRAVRLWRDPNRSSS